MHRSELKKIFIIITEQKTTGQITKKQRNFFVNLLCRTKTEYFQKLNVKDLSHNRKFWKITKPFFNNKGLHSNKIILKENNQLITKKKELATVMNTFRKHNREFRCKEG